MRRNTVARTNFDRFPSSKRLILEWIATVRKPQARQRRIDPTIALANENLRADRPGVRGGR
ncbi:YdeI/OmpD-associated family protein [Rhodococcus sp. NPDC059234]|uniref:YdeI/OmpD-associated family protein n=1 Tax=Rhodococcus sp. NPDC059234 TaxID=3346781 RepID=UPI003670AC3C